MWRKWRMVSFSTFVIFIYINKKYTMTYNIVKWEEQKVVVKRKTI